MLNHRRPVHRTFLPVAGAIVLMSALVVSVSAVEPWPVPAPTPGYDRQDIDAWLDRNRRTGTRR